MFAPIIFKANLVYIKSVAPRSDVSRNIQFHAYYKFFITNTLIKEGCVMPYNVGFKSKYTLSFLITFNSFYSSCFFCLDTIYGLDIKLINSGFCPNGIFIREPDVDSSYIRTSPNIVNFPFVAGHNPTGNNNITAYA